MRLGDLDALKKSLNFVYDCSYIESKSKEGIASDIIDEIDNAPTVFPGSWSEGFHEGFQAGSKLGMAFSRPQGEWISVSERLPNDRDWYLGVFREPDTGFIGIPFICDYVGKITKGTTKEGWILRGFTDTDNPHEYYMCLECVAWQPLPEPYKKEGKEE